MPLDPLLSVHLWGDLGQRRARHIARELERVLQREWHKIPQDVIRWLAGYKRRRDMACIAAWRGHSLYWLVFLSPVYFGFCALKVSILFCFMSILMRERDIHRTSLYDVVQDECLIPTLGTSVAHPVRRAASGRGVPHWFTVAWKMSSWSFVECISGKGVGALSIAGGSSWVFPHAFRPGSSLTSSYRHWR